MDFAEFFIVSGHGVNDVFCGFLGLGAESGSRVLGSLSLAITLVWIRDCSACSSWKSGEFDKVWLDIERRQQH